LKLCNLRDTLDLTQPNINLNARLPQPPEAFPGRARIGVLETAHEPRDASINERNDTSRPPLAHMGARLQSDIDRCPARLIASLCERQGLTMGSPAIRCHTLTNNLTSTNNHASNRRT
jgi:hypothetical protein